MRARRAIVLSQRTRQVALLAQIVRCAKRRSLRWQRPCGTAGAA